MGEWKTIDTAPKDGTFILTWHPEGGRPEISRYVGTYWTRWAIIPTHWMPLPDAPTNSKEGI